MKASRHLIPILLALCMMPMATQAQDGTGATELLATYTVAGPLEDLAWSPDGTRLLVTSGNHALVLSASGGAVLLDLAPPDGTLVLTGVRMAPDGSRIYTSYRQATPGYGEVHAWNASTGEPVSGTDLSGEDFLAISPDGKLRSASFRSEGNRLGVWRISDGLMLLSLDSPGIKSVAFSPDSRRLAIIEEPYNFSIWELYKPPAGPALNSTMLGNTTSLCWSPDGRYLMAGLAYPEIHYNIILQDSRNGLNMAAQFFNDTKTLSVAWSADGTMAMGQEDGTIYLSSFDDGWGNTTFLGNHSAPVTELVWSPDGKTLASASADGTVRLWGTPVVPPPPGKLELTITAERGQAVSGESIALSVRLLDDALSPVAGANVTLASRAGGTFSAVADAGGGNYTVNFTAPAVQANTTFVLSVNASKAGFDLASGRFEILVLPPPAPPRIAEPPVHTDDNTGALLVVSGGAIVVVAAAVAISETGMYSGMVLFIPLFTRMKKQAVLDNFSRGQLHGYIVANPGVHMNAIRDRFALSNGEVAYHLRVLEREGLVSSQSDGLRRRFYPGEGGPRERPQELTFAQNLLIGLMEKNPGITGTELARLTDTSPQVVNYHLKRLWRMELITMDRDGRVVRCFVRPEKLGLFKRATDQKEPLPGETLSWDPA